MQPRKPPGTPEGGRFAPSRHPESGIELPDPAGESPVPAVVDDDVLEILHRLSSSELGRRFYLAGGTALALQIGHRRSNDLDYFTYGERIDRGKTLRAVERVLSAGGRVETVLSEPGQLDLAVGPQRRKVSFIAYPFPLSRPRVTVEGQGCADVLEIAAMKAYTLGRRATARDYVDIEAAITKAGVTLDEIVSVARSRFVLGGESVFSERMFLQQLVYTEDLEDDQGLASFGASFNEVERSLRLIVADYVRRSIP